jgi:glycosyltransferase involved in cell wall biosynthesis
MRNLWYFGLEPLKERYTYQLSEQWIPETFKSKKINFIQLRGEIETNEIRVGSVLDAYGRGVYSMSQCQQLMNAISGGIVKTGDILYLQDFWTPGIESVFYMLDLYNIKVDVYSMLHAQSVDEYDFTHPMRKWMRHFELGIDAYHKGIFVGSGIHKQQLREAGFKAPIHVVGLPIHAELAVKTCEKIYAKRDQIIYTSRLDKEKNPYFMVETALRFLRENTDYKWVVTTSGSEFKSSIPGFVDYMKYIASENDRFILKAGLSKEEYYTELQKSKVQFNSALQDYVSWTLIEATLFDCDVCYPDFRSFPEILNPDRLYQPFKVESAVKVLNDCIHKRQQHHNVAYICDLGRKLKTYIMLNDIGNQEFNVWHEHYYISKLIEKC